MMNYWEDNTGIYSMDMAIRWANDFKIKGTKHDIINVKHLLGSMVWNENGVDIMPLEVILYKDKYPSHWKRINTSNIKCPILSYKDIIVDGYHRLSKAYINNSVVNIIEIPTSVWKKIKIDTIDIDAYNLILMYNTKFKQHNKSIKGDKSIKGNK